MGGAERAALNLANLWCDLGDEVVVMPTYSGGGSGSFYPVCPKVRVCYLANVCESAAAFPRLLALKNFITDENFNTVTTDFKLNYVTLPIMANWHFGSNRNWYLNFGPYVGFLVNAEESELGLDLKDGFKSTDFGFAFGIGYKFEIDDNIKLYIEYDGQSGFSDIFEENSGDAIRNGRSSFNIGALFSL